MPRSDDGAPPVPLVILTGFLGAGKTTVLNRVLGAQRRWRLAVIVNELGRIDIDGKLLRARAGDVVELAGGCVCHEVRTQEELWSALGEVMDRSRPERIVLETSGIAEPRAILEGLRAMPQGGRARVAAAVIVTVVDAQAGATQLERHAEARAQVEEADRLLLTKLELASVESLSALHRALDVLNPRAERAVFPAGAAATEELVLWLLDRNPATAEPLRAHAPQRHPHHPHGHSQSQLVAAAFADDQTAFLPAALLALCDRLGPALVRVKGFVHLAGEDRRAFLERAGSVTGLRLGEPWPPGARRTELVLIGEGLDPGAVRRELLACQAGGPEGRRA